MRAMRSPSSICPCYLWQNFISFSCTLLHFLRIPWTPTKLNMALHQATKVSTLKNCPLRLNLHQSFWRTWLSISKTILSRRKSLLLHKAFLLIHQADHNSSWRPMLLLLFLPPQPKPKAKVVRKRMARNPAVKRKKGRADPPIRAWEWAFSTPRKASPQAQPNLKRESWKTRFFWIFACTPGNVASLTRFAQMANITLTGTGSRMRIKLWFWSIATVQAKCGSTLRLSRSTRLPSPPSMHTSWATLPAQSQSRKRVRNHNASSPNWESKCWRSQPCCRMRICMHKKYWQSIYIFHLSLNWILFLPLLCPC